MECQCLAGPVLTLVVGGFTIGGFAIGGFAIGGFAIGVLTFVVQAHVFGV